MTTGTTIRAKHELRSLLSHDLIQAARRGEPGHVVVLLGSLLINVKWTIQAGIGEVAGMLVLHVPGQFHCGAIEGNRTYLRDVERFKYKPGEFPILHVLVVKVEPQGS